MTTLMCLIVLLGFIYHTYSAEPCKKICTLDNLDCVTSGGFNVYKTVVNGVKGSVAPLDPLHIEKIEGELENLKYKSTNITMTGLKNCTFIKLKLNVTLNTYDQYLHCPKLVLHFHFKTQENTKEPVPRGYGTVTLTAYNNYILNYGLYSVLVNEDHRPHFFVITQDSKIDLKGKLEVTITNTYLTDTNQINTNGCVDGCIWRIFTFLYKLIVTRSMTIIKDEIDVHIRKYTMGEVLPEKNHVPSPHCV